LLGARAKNKIARVTSLASKEFCLRAGNVAALVLMLFACGCSSFNREWRKAGKQPDQPDSVTGRWEGRWLSEVNGHNGKLRCLVSHQTNDIYAARFRATYLKVLRFSYTVPLRVETNEAGWRFQGEEDLGKLGGGVYRYAGTATATNFHSTYHSQHDHGIFEMSRIPAETSKHR